MNNLLNYMYICKVLKTGKENCNLESHVEIYSIISQIYNQKKRGK